MLGLYVFLSFDNHILKVFEALGNFLFLSDVKNLQGCLVAELYLHVFGVYQGKPLWYEIEEVKAFLEVWYVVCGVPVFVRLLIDGSVREGEKHVDSGILRRFFNVAVAVGALAIFGGIGVVLCLAVG